MPSKTPPFVHLHVHSHYSLLDGVVPAKQLIKMAKKNKMPAVALTDHGNMFGAIEFYRLAKEAKIKPVIGSEFYVAPTDRREKRRVDNLPSYWHLTLLAENEQGYRNLIELSSDAFIEGFYSRARTDKDILREHANGIIALSGCMSGEASYWIRHGRRDKAGQTLREYADIFGRDNFFVEIQNHGLEDQKAVTPALIELAKETGLRTVATNDVHYLREDDAILQDVLICIGTGKILSDTNRLSFDTKECYFKTAGEMADLFPEAPEAVAATVEIAARCSLELDSDTYHIPRFTTTDGESADRLFERLCDEGIGNRYGDRARSEEIRNRLDYEMEVIRKLGFVEYFLITWDFIREARSRGIPVGPGRGSAAGSIVSYALRITDIDPLKYGLLFERFLNTDRISMPDIDIDFSKTRRDEVIQYVREKYGQDNVAQIVTFNKLKAKGALKDVGRVLGKPYQEMDRISKLVPDDPKTKLRKAVEDIPELRAEHEKPENRELFDIALKVVGCPRNLSTHAAGVVITPGKLTDYVPLCVVKDVTNTQYEMTALEEIGLLKMDFLGLNTLTIIEAAIDLIKETRGEEIDVGAIPTDDPETYEMLKKGDSLGTFQLESAGMRDVLRKLEPDSLEDLIALISLHRPGPIGSIPSFCDCKHGRRPVEYLHESLREILEPTFGFFVYQEQVMRVAQHMAKFTLNEGDTLRKAMGKKLPKVMKKYEKKFIDGAVGNDVDLSTAKEVWSFIDKFAEYGFNKSHAAAYAVIAIQTAYLKCHYPAEYMAALMTCEMDNTDKVVLYRQDAEDRGLTVHPPDIASGRHAFTVKDGNIIFGLGAVKGVGESAIEAMVKARGRVGKFNSLYHFCEEVDYRFVNRGAMEALVKCGAFDCFGARRPQLLAILEDAMRAGQKKQRDEAIGQENLFRGKFRLPEPPLPDVPELEELDKLRFEKETLGFYLSGHPLDTYRSDIIAFASHTTAEFLELNARPDENGNNIFNARNGRNSRTRASRDKGPEYIIGGLLTGIRRVTTKKGDPMAFASLTDFEGTIEIVVFPSSYQDVMSQLIEDAVIFCRGRANTNREIPTLAAQEIVPVSEAAERFAKCCIIRLKSSDIIEGALGTLKEIVAEFPGPAPLFIQLEKADGSRVLAKCSRNYMISAGEEFRKAITDRIGPGRVHMRGEESMKYEV